METFLFFAGIGVLMLLCGIGTAIAESKGDIWPFNIGRDKKILPETRKSDSGRV
jgi:hypothetical protein